mgnify:CR=1 FL=1
MASASVPDPFLSASILAAYAGVLSAAALSPVRGGLSFCFLALPVFLLFHPPFPALVVLSKAVVFAFLLFSSGFVLLFGRSCCFLQWG